MYENYKEVILSQKNQIFQKSPKKGVWVTLTKFK